MEVCGQRRALNALHPAKELPVRFEQEARGQQILEALEKKNTSRHRRESNNDSSVVYSVAKSLNRYHG
jgi:hypothetical protein